MMLTLDRTAEDPRYYYDATAGERPIKFVEKYLIHFTGRFAGQPFLLAPIQKQIISDLFGWKRKDNGFRRFTEVYWEGAVGAGKSPVLAAIGLYSLLGDREPGAQIYSFASTHPQARIVFDTAKKFVKASGPLSSRLQVRHAEIRHEQSNSFWKIVPGTGPGAGANPSLALGDEGHDWRDSAAYDDLSDRMTKRDQPLMVVATNSGESQASFCWKLRERAVAALEGSGDPALYPIIWAAAEDAKTDDPEAWKAANPLVGTTISESKIAEKCVEMSKNEDDERKFRRLYLSIWPKKQADRWLDLTHWDAAIDGKTPSNEAVTYTGMDLSQSDDLSAVVWVDCDPERIFISAHFWMPRVKAEYYEKAYAIPYMDWAAAGHLTLVDSPTISKATRELIAGEIIVRCRGKKPIAVCYDSWKADAAVAKLEAENIACLPVRQGYSLSHGCNELDVRLKERTASIEANPLLRWNAENVTVKRDDHGNLWPVKPGAEGNYEGLRGLKIDGIAALVTVLTQSRKHQFQKKKINVKAFAI